MYLNDLEETTNYGDFIVGLHRNAVFIFKPLGYTYTNYATDKEARAVYNDIDGTPESLVHLSNWIFQDYEHMSLEFYWKDKY